MPFRPTDTNFSLFNKKPAENTTDDLFTPERKQRDDLFRPSKPATHSSAEDTGLFTPEGAERIPDPEIITRSLTPGSATQIPEEQKKVNPRQGESITDRLLQTREFFAGPARKSLEGLQMLTDMIPDPEFQSTAVNITLGLPKTIAEVGSEFASSFIHPDTLLMVGGLKGAGKLATTKTGQKIIAKVIEKIPENIKRALTYRFGQPQVYVDHVEQGAINLRIGNELVGSVGDKINAFSMADQQMIFKYLKVQPGAVMTTEMKVAADAVRGEFSRLGKDFVDLGLLDAAKYQKNLNTYLPRLYRNKELANKTPRLGSNKPLRANLDRFKHRKDIPEDIRLGMGEILEAGYPTSKGLLQLNQAVQKYRMFRNIAKEGNLVTSQRILGLQKGFKKLPDTKSLGDLSGKYVHPEVERDLMQIIKPPDDSILGAFTGKARWWRKTLGTWKFGKVVLSPSTHTRNILTNSFWLDISGINHVQQAKALPRIIKDLLAKGPLYQIALRNGLIGTELVGAEIKPFQLAMQGKQATTMWEMLKKASDAGKKLANKAGKTYQAEEQTFKMIKLDHNLKKGMSEKAASLDAEQWIFNYNKVPPAIEALRNSAVGIPFVTYISKALPLLAKAMIKNPLRVYKYQMMFDAMERTAMRHLGINKDQLDVVRRKGGQLIPFDRPDGRGQMLDSEFLAPWGGFGDFGTQPAFFGGLPQQFTPSGPAYAIANALLFNYDPYTKRNIRDPELDNFDQQVTKVTNYLGKALLPNLTPGVTGVDSAFRGGSHFQKIKAAFAGPGDAGKEFPIQEPLSRTEAVLGAGFGLRTGPIDIPLERAKQFERQEALSQKLIARTEKLVSRLDVNVADRNRAIKRIAPKIKDIFGLKPTVDFLLEHNIKVERTTDMSPLQKILVDNELRKKGMRRLGIDKQGNSLMDRVLKSRGDK